MKNSKVTRTVVTVATGVTMAVMVGQITPVNLQSVSKDFAIVTASDFSTSVAKDDCCGPYAQPCPEFKCAAPY
jgi:hypothetical protein